MLSCRFCYKLRCCPKLTLSVEFILSVRLALNGPNMLTSFCGTKKEINNQANRTRNDLIILQIRI